MLNETMPTIYKHLKLRLNYKLIAVILTSCIGIYFLVYRHQTRITENAVKKKQVEDEDIHLIILFSKANKLLEKKFSTFIQSLFQHASVLITLHIVGDDVSHEIAKKHLKVAAKQLNYKVNFYNLATIAEPLEKELKAMQKYFSYKDGSYYSGTLFFISAFLHRIFNFEKVVMVDIDVYFVDDIYKLYQHLYKFNSSALIGVAYEQQPVYRHVFQLYRQENVNTSIGNPLPGYPGFNSGVLLLNLDRMRNSGVYNEILNVDVIHKLSEKYKFKGHLGDQDFFTLIALDFRELFYVLPCGWNRQLCDWWRHHGYDDIFEKFHSCNDVVSLYHGNCNSHIPVN